MISSFATAVHALWMVDTIIYVDAETLEIGKDCPKWKRFYLAESGCAIMLLIIIRKSPRVPRILNRG